MRKLERLRDADRPGAVKVKLEMCGDVWFVLTQEISRSKFDRGVYQKSNAGQNVAEAALPYPLKYRRLIFHGGEGTGWKADKSYI